MHARGERRARFAEHIQVEVLERGVAWVCAHEEDVLDAALDDGLVHLGEGLSGFRSRRARLRGGGDDYYEDDEGKKRN